MARWHHDRYLDTVRLFKGADGTADPTALLAGDGDHPNNLGQRVLADAVVDVLRRLSHRHG